MVAKNKVSENPLAALLASQKASIDTIDRVLSRAHTIEVFALDVLGAEEADAKDQRPKLFY